LIGEHFANIFVLHVTTTTWQRNGCCWNFRLWADCFLRMSLCCTDHCIVCRNKM